MIQLILWLLLATLIVLSFLRSVVYHFFLRPYPGPFPWPVLGNVIELLRHDKELGALVKKYSHYGPVFELWLPERFVVINSPAAAYEALEEKGNNFSMRPALDDALKLLGMYHQGLVMNNDLENWKFSRGLFLRGLHQQFLQQIPAIVVEKWNLLHTHNTFVKNRHGATDVHDMCKRLITDTVGEITLGLDLQACRSEVPEIVQLVNDWLELWIVCQYELPFVWKNPFNSHVKKLRQSSERRKQLMSEMVERLLKQYNNNKSSSTPPQHAESKSKQLDSTFINIICKAYCEGSDTGVRLSIEQVQQIVFELIVGGTDTSTNTLTYCMMLLAENPIVQQTLYNEVESVLQGEPVAWKHIAKLQYTEQVLRETFRHRPLHSVIIRMNQHEDTIGGYRFPARTAVGVRTFPTTASNVFPYPNEFNPDNFSPAVLANIKGVASPFGGGTRQCPGTGFAMVEMKAVLAVLMQKYRLEQYNGASLAKLKSSERIVVVCTEPAWVKLVPRK